MFILRFSQSCASWYCWRLIVNYKIICVRCFIDDLISSMSLHAESSYRFSSTHMLEISLFSVWDKTIASLKWCNARRIDVNISYNSLIMNEANTSSASKSDFRLFSSWFEKIFKNVDRDDVILLVEVASEIMSCFRDHECSHRTSNHKERLQLRFTWFSHCTIEQRHHHIVVE